MKAAINDVAAIQPAVGGGAAVAAPAVAVGNNTVPHGIMSDWDVNGMVSLLESISLDHLSKAFIENGFNGAFPPVLAGGVGQDWSYRIAVQENHGLCAGWAERSMSQPLAVVFLPAVGGFLPWRGQPWRRRPTLEGWHVPIDDPVQWQWPNKKQNKKDVHNVLCRFISVFVFPFCLIFAVHCGRRYIEIGYCIYSCL